MEQELPLPEPQERGIEEIPIIESVLGNFAIESSVAPNPTEVIAQEAVPAEVAAEPTEQEYTSPKIQNELQVQTPTREWHQGFKNKVNSVLETLEKIDLDPEKVRLIIEKNEFQMPEAYFGIRFEDAVALLLKLPGTKRLLLSDKTRDDAVKILIEELNK